MEDGEFEGTFTVQSLGCLFNEIEGFSQITCKKDQVKLYLIRNKVPFLIAIWPKVNSAMMFTPATSSPLAVAMNGPA